METIEQFSDVIIIEFIGKYVLPKVVIYCREMAISLFVKVVPKRNLPGIEVVQ